MVFFIQADKAYNIILCFLKLLHYISTECLESKNERPFPEVFVSKKIFLKREMTFLVWGRTLNTDLSLTGIHLMIESNIFFMVYQCMNYNRTIICIIMLYIESHLMHYLQTVM